jgi:LTXXQ motif family protein
MASDIEGRIASLKTELKITDAQAPAWNRFADALRATAGSMNEMYQQMMQSGSAATLPARLERQQTMLAGHLSRVKTLKETLDPLYASFIDAQKKIADGVMIGPMGMM